MKVCGARKKDVDTVHHCGRAKGHKSKHQCRMVIAGKRCNLRWARDGGQGNASED
jgi:hypothetical protein